MKWHLPSRLLLSASLLLVILPSTPLYAVDLDADCTSPGEHELMTFLLVDRSDELERTENLKKSLTAVENMIKPGERLLIGVSTGKGSDTRVVMDLVRPKKSLWVSTLTIRSNEKKFDECFAAARALLEKQDESYDRSAILETLSFVSKALKADSSQKKRIIMYSDMIQNSPSLSFYNAKEVNPELALKTAEKEYLLHDFNGVQVHVAGVGAGVTDKKARAIEHFWNKYFEKTGGTLKYYGPVLLVS